MAKGVWVDDEFDELKTVLDHWVDMIEQYSKAIEKDACYWFNERATLSVLAAASWRSSGWIALEEYSTDKIRSENKNGKKKGEEKTGRCDLYLCGPEYSYACEAKQAWHKVENNCDYSGISAALDAAWKASSELSSDEADKRLAMCFCVPHFEKEPKKVDIDKWVNGCKNFNHIAFAYSFPETNRCLKGDDNTYYPGVALIIQWRQRGMRT